MTFFMGRIAPMLTPPTEFFCWWVIDERTGKRRRTTYKLSRAHAALAFPMAEPDPQTREVRDLPSAGEAPPNRRPGEPSMSNIDELRHCHQAWQKARRDFYERLDKSLAGAPMDWERMTAAVTAMDKCLREFMGTAERPTSTQGG